MGKLEQIAETVRLMNTTPDHIDDPLWILCNAAAHAHTELVENMRRQFTADMLDHNGNLAAPLRAAFRRAVNERNYWLNRARMIELRYRKHDSR